MVSGESEGAPWKLTELSNHSLGPEGETSPVRKSMFACGS